MDKQNAFFGKRKNIKNNDCYLLKAKHNTSTI